MGRRRCLQCERPLYPSEQGALCSECYFAIITDPGLADPPRPIPGAAGGADSADPRRWAQPLPR